MPAVKWRRLLLCTAAAVIVGVVGGWSSVAGAQEPCGGTFTGPGFCDLPPRTVHAVDAAGSGGAGILLLVDSCSAVVSREGDVLFGCPGDTATAADIGAPPGSAGVAGYGLLRVVSSSPIPAQVASAGTVAILTPPGVPDSSSLVPDAVAAAWPVFLALSAFVIGLVVFRKVRRA